MLCMVSCEKLAFIAEFMATLGAAMCPSNYAMQRVSFFCFLASCIATLKVSPPRVPSESYT
jgi:hypothetical protein